jgi:selenocysteine lyase/cysteine desulfurase
MDPERLREEIPALDTCRYCNWGASGPSPRAVVAAANEFEKRHQFDAPCGDGMYTVARDALESARESVAAFVGATPAEIALTRSTVEGINHVVNAIDWNEGDVVLRTDLEHPAGVLPWERARETEGTEIRELPTERGRLDRESLRDAVSDARLVCLSSLSWSHGTKLPVEEVVDLAHDAGARVLVDAVQSPGQVPVDVDDWGADFVAASGHKWLLGLWGSGFLYVDEDALDAVTPGRIGYFSVEEPGADYEFRSDARQFELGTTAVAPYVALEAAIEQIEAVGIERIDEHISRLTDRLKEGLGDRLVSPRDSESGLVTFAADDPDAVVERLGDHGIQIRSIPDPHACRVSVHAPNTAEDIDALLDTL